MDEKKPLFAEILLPLPLKGTFTYRVPVDYRDEAETGKRAVVPFGRNKIYAGLIFQLHQNEPQKYKAKDVRGILDDKPVITNQQSRLWEWISRYYMAFMGETMNAALPSAMKLASESKVKLHPAYDGVVGDLSMAEYKILENLGDNVALSIKEISKITGYKNVMPVIKNLIEKECVIMQEELQNSFKPKKEPFLRLTEKYVESEQELQNLLDNFSNKAYRQMEVLMMFLSKTGNERSASVARKRIMGGETKYNAAIRSLVDKEILVEEKKTISRIDRFKAAEDVSSIQLTADQNRALTQIHEGFEKDKVSLLHGVTSSGKTEIYIHLIEEQLQKNKQVLYLLPEIALTAQIISRLTNYFGSDVVVYHSRFSEQERTETWDLVLNKQRRLIVGARSSLFLPFQDLGLVIVDEEHDNSFKQFEPAPRYQGRDVAVYLGKMFNARVILGTATPSVESYANVKAGKYHLAELLKRYGDIQLPEIQVADLVKASKQNEMYSHYSYMLLRNIRETLDKGLQVILFQNRRGFSLRVQCHQCGWMPDCPNCDVGMIYHKFQDYLRCHYCGHKEKVPQECPECGSTSVKMQGFGTEKIEEELPNHFPNARIARMDMDSTRSKNAYYRLISDFEARKLDILVGTQMVTKGLDFDHVGLVGVMNMDNMLGFPDFRAFEKAYQLLAQVSGRAGRKGERGKVIVQTRQPYHSVIRYAMENDYHSMFESQLQERKTFKYPPYYRLIRLTLKHKNQDTVYKASQMLAGALRAKLGKRILGPEFPAIARIRRLYLRDILVKIANNEDRKSIKKFILDEIRVLNKENDYKSVQVVVDVDPV